jgi:hypothetical protein
VEQRASHPAPLALQLSFNSSPTSTSPSSQTAPSQCPIRRKNRSIFTRELSYIFLNRYGPINLPAESGTARYDFRAM